MAFPWTKRGQFYWLFGVLPFHPSDPMAQSFNSRCAKQKIGYWQDRMVRNLQEMTRLAVKENSLDHMTEEERRADRHAYFLAYHDVRRYQRLIARAKRLAKAMGLDLTDLEVYGDYDATNNVER